VRKGGQCLAQGEPGLAQDAQSGVDGRASGERLDWAADERKDGRMAVCECAVGAEDRFEAFLPGALLAV